MRVAVLSDIHGNSVALDAVLSDLPADINELWILGDLVGYYYDIKKVLNSLSAYKYYCIKGNHEDYLKKVLDSEEFGQTYKEKYGSSLEYASKNLSNEDLQFLINLPTTLCLQDKYLLAHGAPWSFEEYTYPNATNEILDIFLNYKENFIFIGHTHYPMKINHNNKTIINPGSVGQQRSGVLGAHWGIFNLENEDFEFKITAYDIGKVEKQVSEIDPSNAYLSSILRRQK